MMSVLNGIPHSRAPFPPGPAEFLTTIPSLSLTPKQKGHSAPSRHDGARGACTTERGSTNAFHHANPLVNLRM